MSCDPNPKKQSAGLLVQFYYTSEISENWVGEQLFGQGEHTDFFVGSGETPLRWCLATMGWAIQSSGNKTFYGIKLLNDGAIGTSVSLETSWSLYCTVRIEQQTRIMLMEGLMAGWSESRKRWRTLNGCGPQNWHPTGWRTDHHLLCLISECDWWPHQKAGGAFALNVL